MTKAEFDREIARLERRVELLRRARRGDAALRRVTVREHWVKGHWKAEHERLVAPSRGPRLKSG